MAQQTLNDDESGLTIRGKINTNFSELYNSDQETVVLQANGVIAGHKLVSSLGGFISYADSSSLEAINNIIGISTNAATNGEDVTIVTSGYISESGWNFTPSDPIFVGANGALTQSVDGSMKFILIVGFADTATSIFIDIKVPIIL